MTIIENCCNLKELFIFCLAEFHNKIKLLLSCLNQLRSLTMRFYVNCLDALPTNAIYLEYLKITNCSMKALTTSFTNYPKLKYLELEGILRCIRKTQIYNHDKVEVVEVHIEQDLQFATYLSPVLLSGVFEHFPYEIESFYCLSSIVKGEAWDVLKDNINDKLVKLEIKVDSKVADGDISRILCKTPYLRSLSLHIAYGRYAEKLTVSLIRSLISCCRELVSLRLPRAHWKNEDIIILVRNLGRKLCHLYIEMDEDIHEDVLEEIRKCCPRFKDEQIKIENGRLLALPYSKK
jgi:hypothetical protein